MSHTLTFWFDLHSPWVYLASHEVGNVARKHGCTLLWRPLHLPRMQVAIKGRIPLNENKSFVTWYEKDLADWAEVRGLPLDPHKNFPLRNSRAIRSALYAADHGKAEAFVKRVSRAYWSEQGDITDLDKLAEWGESCELDGEAIKSAAVSAEMKARIDANTDEAIKRGVFGVPTVDTGAKLYFGNDRLWLLDRHLSEGRQF